MIFRNIRIFIFVALLLNQNVRKNKSILILISSLIIQEIAISLMISTNIAKFHEVVIYGLEEKARIPKCI